MTMDHSKPQIELSDIAIIEIVLAGNHVAFEMLVRRYNSFLYRIAREFGFNHQNAEDLMQETHVTAFLHLAQLKHPRYYKSWIAKIMSHKCLYEKMHGYYGRETFYGQLKDDFVAQAQGTRFDNHAEENIIKRELAAILDGAVQSLPDVYRTAFILKEVEGFSIKETAAYMRITPANVKIRLVRARALMQKMLQSAYAAKPFEFNLIYCDKVVQKVLQRISQEKQLVTYQ